MPSRLKRGMKEELPEEEVEALLRWCGMVKSAADQRKSDASEDMKRPEVRQPDSKRPEIAGKVGHPYRRRLNNKGERQ
jgi:hypothetical protein